VIISYFFPTIIFRASTRYNRDVRVVEEKGTNKLLVNGSRQSGEYIKELWEHAFRSFGLPSNIQNILVLGVAGGTVIHLLHAMYPDAKITGVDIDKTMIDIGKKYFGLGSVPGLSLVTDDAKNYIQNNRKQWDMIVIDLFVGASIPPFVGEETFLLQMKKYLSSKGNILINYLYELEYKRLSEIFMLKLQKLFTEVHDYTIYYNRFFYVVK